MGLSTLLIVGAVVCFVLALLGLDVKVDLVVLGLALFAAGHLPMPTITR